MLPWYVVCIKERWLQNTSWNHCRDKQETHQNILHDAIVSFKKKRFTAYAHTYHDKHKNKCGIVCISVGKKCRVPLCYTGRDLFHIFSYFSYLFIFHIFSPGITKWHSTFLSYRNADYSTFIQSFWI